LLSERYIRESVTSLLLVSLDADVVNRFRLAALLALLLPRDVGDVTGDVVSCRLYAAAVLYDGGDIS